MFVVRWVYFLCYTDCGDLTSPIDGTVSTVNGTTYLQNAIYNCDSGFDMNGNVSRVCEDGGTWSGIAPTCQPVGKYTYFSPPYSLVTINVHL